VLRAAAQQTREWQKRYPSAKDLRINVNLSTKQFSQPGLVERVKEVLIQTGLDGSHLTLEITESAIMEESKALAEMLEQIRKMNVRLYLDDFGTGYSSLGYLHRFPIHSLKIHSSFVWQLGKQDDQTQLVRTITTLAENMNMGVVAEGVETPRAAVAAARPEVRPRPGLLFLEAARGRGCGVADRQRPHLGKRERQRQRQEASRLLAPPTPLRGLRGD